MIKNKIEKIKKIIALTTLVLLLLLQVRPALADDVTGTTTPPIAPTAPNTTISAPTAPTPPDLSSIQSPTAPTTPDLSAIPTPIPPSSPNLAIPTPIPPNTFSTNNTSSTNPDTNTDDRTRTTSSPTTASDTGKQDKGGNVGDTLINTGGATNTGAIITNANNNLALGSGGAGGSASVINSNNGSDSTNSGSATTTDNNSTNQNNSATVNNDLGLTTLTGQNDSSKNVGNTTIKTGDANTSGTIITGVNTNLNGVSVSEFNVADNHVGDIILDFGAGCTINCQGSSSQASNTGNGTGSTNDSSVNNLSSDQTFQNNDANVGNTMTLVADAGNNTADKNTNGDTYIQTGDANVDANALTFANNNIDGNIIYGVVNIYGGLQGDIILPQSSIDAACGNCSTGSALAENSGNGSDSTNNASTNSTTSDTTNQINNANINNNLTFNATTGDNTTGGNTGGDNLIQTGAANVNAQAINVANTNIDGGDVWLVIINNGGQWSGQLIGAPAGSLFAGSDGTQFTVDADGNIIVTNSGNGSGSTNNATATSTTNNSTTQTNNANITNNINLSANTGGNSASKNTGGDSVIKTGNANIIANIVNFANNNIKGNGKLIVTVVNVFGSWVGDFLTPGHTKPQGASSSNNQTAQNNSNNSVGSGVIAGGSTNTINVQSASITASPSNTGSTTGGVGKLLISAASIHDFTANRILGENNNQSKTGDDNGKVTINLAWAVMFMPFVLLVLVFRKKLGRLRLRRAYNV